MHPGRLLAATGAALTLLLGGCASSPGYGPPPTGEGTTRYAAPGVDGACTPDDPCDIVTAVAGAHAGDRVELAEGDYGDLALRSGGGHPDASVVITGAQGAIARIGELRTSIPYLLWTNVTVTGAWFLDDGAQGAELDAVHIDGGGLFVRTEDVVVRDSLIENGSSIDGIQIASAARVLIEGNTIRDFDQRVDNGRHADCIQLFDVDEVTIRANRISDCYNAGIIISGGGRGLNDLLIESNFVQGCAPVTDDCGGGATVELREPGARGLVVRNNTFLDGSVRWGSVDGNVFDRNLVDYLSECATVMTNTIVANWNRKMCAQPEHLGADGNREAEVAFVDRAAGDLRPVDPASIRIDGTTGTPAPTGIDGVALAADVAGASAG